MSASLPLSIDEDAALLDARYGAAHAPASGPTNDVLRTILGHRSVRAFLPRALPPGTLEMLVAAAQSAATSSNLQAWSVVAVEDTGRKSRLAKVASGQAHIEQCPLFLVFLADLSRLARVGEAKGLRLEGLDYLEAFIVAAVDAALAAQNAVVALESLGLGAVYIGALRNDPEAVARELGLPAHVMAAFGLCVGYEDPKHPAAIKPRLPQSAVLHREHYNTGDAEAIAAFDTTLSVFSHAQGMADTDWTGRVVARVRTAASLNGRDRMTAILNALGFPLK